MDFIYSQYTDIPHEQDWVIPNLRKDRHRWINDEFATAPLEFKHKTGFKKYGKCYGHFSRPVQEDEICAGCRITIDGNDYVILKLIGKGTTHGSVILNGNPPSGLIENIQAYEHTDEGVQFIFSDDGIYDPDIHGQFCSYDAWGINGYNLGDYIVNTKNYRINEYTTLVGDYAPDDRTVEVEDVSKLLVGQEILFHQTQQAYSLKLAGAYSYNYIDKIDTDKKLLKLRYPLGECFRTIRANEIDACVCQVITVPHFKSLVIEKDCSLVCKPWDGKSGGIIVFRALKYFENYGTIDVSYCGFRGGKDHIRWWWYNPPGPIRCDPFYRSYIANCGGEGLAGLDLNWGLISRPIPEEPLSYYTNPNGDAYPIDADSNWPKYIEDPQCPNNQKYNPLVYRNIVDHNARRVFGGGSYKVAHCSYSCSHFDDYAGSTPGSGGGSYDPGGPCLGTGYHRCYFGGNCAEYTFPISDLGGEPTEVDRGLRLNLGGGGASGYMWHMGTSDCAHTFQPTRIWSGADGGNGGGLILINTKVCNNFGEFRSDGETAKLNFHWYDGVSPCKMRPDPEASTAGGGGAGTIAIFSETFNNYGNLSLIGGKGFQLRRGSRCQCLHPAMIEYRDYYSGKGGDGHFIYIAQRGLDKSLVKCAKKEQVNNLFELRLNGYFGYDYRLMWSYPQSIWMAQFSEIDMTKIFRLNYYDLVYTDRNIDPFTGEPYFYDSTYLHRFGITINGKLKLYDLSKSYWERVFDHDKIRVQGEDRDDHDKLKAFRAIHYMSYSCVCDYVNKCSDQQTFLGCGAYFALSSTHQIFSPLVTSVDFYLTKYPYCIWNVNKRLDTNTVLISDFGGILDF